MVSASGAQAAGHFDDRAGHPADVAVTGHAGVVDQHVDPAEAIQAFLDHSSLVPFGCHVALNRGDVCTFRRQRGHRLGGLAAVHVGHQHAPAVRQHRLRDGQADALRAAGHDGDPLTGPRCAPSASTRTR
jgi:hypothetical protein